MRPNPDLVPRGSIDGIAADGTIAGWAWLPGCTQRCHVRILDSDGSVLGEALADVFRSDLLRAGMGLGHCGFFASVRRKLPPGPRALRLVEPRLDRPIGREVLVDVPAPRPGAAPSVYVRPSARPAWRDEEVLAYLGQFELERHRQRMGTVRFVDVVFRYILNRWADDGGLSRYSEALDAGELTCEQVFAILLACEERKAIATPLPAPHDYRFPFGSPDLAAFGQDAAA